MSTQASSEAFIPYPTHRVVGTISDPNDARTAIQTLVTSGFAPEEIDVLHGEDDLRRLDPSGVDHGFLARFQRTLIRLAGAADEYRHLRHHVDDVRAGRFVIMVLAPEHDRRELAADILRAHGAEFLAFYGRWSYEELTAPGVHAPQPPGAPPRDDGFEMHVGGMVDRVEWETDASATVFAAGETNPQRARATVLRVRPDVLLLTWQRPDRAAVVRVADLGRGTAFGIVAREGTFLEEKGTVRRVR